MSEFKISRIRYKWKGEWSSGNSYLADDVVNYGGNVYVCLVGHTAESGGGFYNDLTSVVTNTAPLEPAPRWEKMMEGFQWTGDWSTSIPYNINDLVRDDGIVYRCITPHTSVSSTTQGIATDLVNWTVYASTDAWRTDWAPSTKYKLNDIVRNGAIVYRCIVDHISAILVSDGLEVNQANWQIVHSGVDYKSVWIPGRKHRVNDIVKWGARAWICITSHIATGTFDETKWIVYAPGLEYENQWIITTNYQIGDVVKYGGYSYFSKTFNIGMVPSTQLADWEFLSVGYNLEGDYNNSTAYQVGDVVRRNGYLYACIANAQGVDPTNIAYWEIVTTSFKWRDNWSSGIAYELGDIIIFQSSAYQCVLKHTSAGPSRPDLDISATYWIMYSQGDTTNRLRSLGDINVYGITEDGSTIASTRLPIGNSGELLTVDTDTILPNWEKFTEITKVYFVSVDGADAANRGDTIDRPWRTIKYACQNVIGPATIFIKTGNYEEILPISVPADVALVGDELRGTNISPQVGYEQSNMFYVRNGSGIRNMTLTGLSSTLSAFNIYLTRRPVTNVAFVSLDPGTGPTDVSVQITTRSPYIQNVTTFGTACVGLKVDGNLHNAGNRSIVANDFTQVISDGIGAWVTNNARAELVSVFSYYAHIGYLAENGGKIRATNGNSSYGTFGTVAEGVDSSEVPITGVINNRSTAATVASAFSGQAGDQILLLEYSHCGQNYGAANYTFIGAGTGAIASTVIRNNAVSEVRIKTPGDSSSAGGGGYLNTSNNAQSGDTLTITLAANDPNEAVNYLGMRIIITSGTGTGQYGYIQAYDSGTKLATVYNESTGAAGWDHLASFAIHPALDTTTVYSIEPRVIFAAPLTGTRATGRVSIRSGRISLVKIWDCGEGYITPPAVTIVDPNNTSDAVLEARIAFGVLGPVTWVDRGINYQTSSTSVTITGNGFADKFQTGDTLVLAGVSSLPGPGDNLTISGINDVVYKIVNVTLLSGVDPNLSLRISVSPIIEIEESPAHNIGISIRQNYSQVRLTGHDFLDIGTGNFASTSYPALYADYNFVPAPENEVVENGGGRVFYTSTDQDGNFRVGELFKVEQTTGIVTISASLFNLSGLEELSIGGVVVGGTGVVIREFSTDATFTADSNNIIPTQRAIKAYVEARISGGGSEAFTSILTAGVVRVGPNTITTTTGTAINVDAKVNFNGTIDGTLLAFDFFKKSFI